jgi:hypothetical protein
MIQFKKPLIMYGLGFSVGLAIPHKYFQKIMTYYYNNLNDRITIVEFEEHFSII